MNSITIPIIVRATHKIALWLSVLGIIISVIAITQ